MELLKDEELEIPPKPTRQRFLINDTTVEKLGELLNENPNGVLLYRDELPGWLKTMDREDRANDRSFYLQAFNGNGSYAYDRIGRGTTDIAAVTVSILGGIQPAKLRHIVCSSLTGGAQDDGLLQRIQLMVYPDLNKQWKYVDRYPDVDAKNNVYEIFKIIAGEMQYPAPDDMALV